MNANFDLVAFRDFESVTLAYGILETARYASTYQNAILLTMLETLSNSSRVLSVDFYSLVVLIRAPVFQSNQLNTIYQALDRGRLYHRYRYLET
jgi:hypothetical protein